MPPLRSQLSIIVFIVLNITHALQKNKYNKNNLISLSLKYYSHCYNRRCD